MGPWGQEPQKVGGWPSKHKGDIGGHGARSHGAMEAWGSRAMEGGWSGGRAKQAERAERGGHALGL